jgi:hypothetical protein
MTFGRVKLPSFFIFLVSTEGFRHSGYQTHYFQTLPSSSPPCGKKVVVENTWFTLSGLIVLSFIGHQTHAARMQTPYSSAIAFQPRPPVPYSVINLTWAQNFQFCLTVNTHVWEDALWQPPVYCSVSATTLRWCHSSHQGVWDCWSPALQCLSSLLIKLLRGSMS